MILVKERSQYLINSEQDRKRIEIFCQKLQSLIEDKYGSYQVVHCFESANRYEGKYLVYLKKGSNNSNPTNIELSMSFYYSKKSAHYQEEDEDINNTDLEIILKERSKLMFLTIDNFSVNPKRTGIGSSIIKNIIRLLKSFPDLIMITLTPKNYDARKFWEFIEFISKPEEGNNYRKFKPVILHDEMTYMLN